MTAQNFNILVVEDDPNDVLLIRRAFHKANVSNPLHFVANGEEATSYLAGEGKYADRKHHPLPRLMLLDLKLPRKSGLEVLDWVRKHKTPLRRLPVIILTSSRQSIDINRAYDLGANSYLVKPGKFDELVELVKTFELYWVVRSQWPDLSEER